jgi:hypothetical protein
MEKRDFINTSEISGEITWRKLERRHGIDQDECLCGQFIDDYVKTPNTKPGYLIQKQKRKQKQSLVLKHCG